MLVACMCMHIGFPIYFLGILDTMLLIIPILKTICLHIAEICWSAFFPLLHAHCIHVFMSCAYTHACVHQQTIIFMSGDQYNHILKVS